jgi:hypothetical protein
VVPEHFLKFGAKAFDHLLAKSDDGHSGPVAVRNIEFLNLKISEIFVYTNGFITLNAELTDASQLPDGSSEFSPELGQNYILAPFWSDASTINGGDVFYRHVLDTESLVQISEEIHLLRGDSTG